MSKYTCRVEGCDYVKELFYNDGVGIKEIIAHDKTHEKILNDLITIEETLCKECDGKGYTYRQIIIKRDVPKTD